MDTSLLPHYGVPRPVLTGYDKRFAKLYAYFRARMTQEWLRRLNSSYWTRAQGGTDKVAGFWTKLKKWTIKEKRELEEDGKHLTYVTPGQLPADTGLGLESATEEYTKKFNEILNNDTSKSSMATKRARARKAALEEMGDRSFAKLINIRTGRLVAATYPGEVVNNRYYPTKDQLVYFLKTKIRFSLRKVEYASEVDAQREIIPRNTDVWYTESWNIVVPEVAVLYKEMIEANPRLKRPYKFISKNTRGLEDAPS